MKRVLLFGLLLWLLPVSSSTCWAEVPLTDQEFQELTNIFHQLEILTEAQKETIRNLQNENSVQSETIRNLQNQSNDKLEILNRQQVTLQQQKILLQEEKKYWTKLAVGLSILTLACGIVIGALL